MLKRSVVFLLFCISTISRAQVAEVEPSTLAGPASDALIQQWLASDKPRLRTWAAHFILVQSRFVLVPELQDAANPSTCTQKSVPLRRKC